jgi:hypothetical protein
VFYFRKQRMIRLFALIALATVGGTACVHAPECPLVDCINGLMLRFQGPATWAPGEYVVDIEADGEKSRCNLVIPIVAPPPQRCTRPHVFLELGPQGPDGLTFTLPPNHVHVTLSRNGKTIGELDTSPAYRKVYPAGDPRCGPPCTNAWVYMAVSADATK